MHHDPWHNAMYLQGSHSQGTVKFPDYLPHSTDGADTHVIRKQHVCMMLSNTGIATKLGIKQRSLTQFFF